MYALWEYWVSAMDWQGPSAFESHPVVLLPSGKEIRNIGLMHRDLVNGT